MKSILSVEKVAYSVMLQQEADMIAALAQKSRDSTEPTEYEMQTQPLMQPLVPQDWAITDLEMEVLLKSMCVCAVCVMMISLEDVFLYCV